MGKQKFVRLFGRDEIHLTACAVNKTVIGSSCVANADIRDYIDIRDYMLKPNQFWSRDPNHERALLKIYKRDLEEDLTYWNPVVQTVEIPMPFWGKDSSDGWGELQFLIKEPAAVKLARCLSFDTRVNQWVKETKLIQPKTDLETHTYLALRFYHQDYLPPVPGDWHFEPVYVSIRNSDFYRIDVLWEEEEIKITVTVLDKDLPEIPKHLK